MSPINGFIIISILFSLGYLVSVISFFTDHEAEKCEMTYMFEYPQFVRIENKLDFIYPKYGLYVYSEGRLTERARNIRFDGIPVLFIPGSGGSHKQVRSLASIALRKALNSHKTYHFDYFALDYNKEHSAMEGSILEGQLAYANQSKHDILKLYEKNENRPTSIIVIGHSMGGMISKALLKLDMEKDHQISLVLTLSAPLIRPVINLDYYIDRFYKKYDFNVLSAENTTFISIVGGFNDYLVPAFYTLQGHLTVTATNVPKSWVSPNHLSILWCKQLIMAINRALFDSVDILRKQITHYHEHRLDIFKHHLTKHSGIKIQDGEKYNYPISINSNGDWYSSINRQYSVRLLKGTRDPKYYMIPMVVAVNHDSITVVAINMKSRDWAFVCPALSMKGSQRICDVARHLTQITEISPSLNYKRRTLRMDLAEVKKKYSTSTHVLIRVQTTDEPVILHIDFHSAKQRTYIINDLPKWFTYKKHTIIEKTEEKAIQYQLILPQLSQIIQAYVIHVEASECTGHTSHATAQLMVPWDNQESHGFFTENEKKPFIARLTSPRPFNKVNESAVVVLTLDPSCRYKISLTNTYHFGNMARFYSILLIANVAAVALMTLRCQLINIAEKERCSLFFIAMKEGAKPYYIVTTVKILSRMLSFKNETILPASDWKVLTEENLDFLLLPLLLYIVSVGVVWLLAVGLSISFMFFETTVHKLALKFVSKGLSATPSWMNNITKTFEKLPGAVSLFLIGTSITASGGLAICLATIFYYIKLTQMAQDFIEDVVKTLLKSISTKVREKLVLKIKKKWREMRMKITKKVENNELEQIEHVNEKRKEELETKSDKPERNEEKSDSSSLETEENLRMEKPMEIEFCAGDDPNKIQRVDGVKLVQLLEANTNEPKDSNFCDENKTESSTPIQNVFKHVNFDWLKEMLETNEIFFHFTMFMIYLVVAGMNVPTVITWAHNFRYSKHLEPDPAFIPGFILSACTFALWQFEFPKVERRFFHEISHFVYGAAVICLLYGIVSIYRLSFILSGVVAVVTLHQLLPINKPESNENEQNSVTKALDNIENDSYQKTVKDKLD